MLFSSVPFLYWFLPLMLLAYYTIPKGGRNVALLVGSLCFYYYGEASYLYIMLCTTVSAYVFGLVINKAKRKKLPLVLSLSVSLVFLLVFKYADFFIENINHLGASLSPLELIMPIGISFYTFQAMSYSIDLYRGNAKVQKNLLHFACYISFFPQLIAGPIVRYTTIEHQLDHRVHSMDKFSDGAFRFVIGLSKKVLIANVLGEFCAHYIATDTPSVLYAWGWAIAYSLQIYFDFSGYSDMAIGLGKLFGFDFPENFNYPFTAKSITDFWRRWHMSLGTWFRDYVYIPMGGNRVGLPRFVVNIFTVWFLTGFWHGASWNFILWGLYFAVFLLLEKLFLHRILQKLPQAISHLYLILTVVVSFVLFNSVNLTDLVKNLGYMFGKVPWSNVETLYYLRSYAVVFLIAMIGATPLVKQVASKWKGGRVQTVAQPMIMIALLLCVTAFLIEGSFNPFLYFRF